MALSAGVPCASKVLVLNICALDSFFILLDFLFFLFLHCNTPSRGLRAGGLHLNVVARSEKDDRVKRHVQID